MAPLQRAMSVAQLRSGVDSPLGYFPSVAAHTVRVYHMKFEAEKPCSSFVDDEDEYDDDCEYEIDIAGVVCAAYAQGGRTGQNVGRKRSIDVCEGLYLKRPRWDVATHVLWPWEVRQLEDRLRLDGTGYEAPTDAGVEAASVFAQYDEEVEALFWGFREELTLRVAPRWW